MPVRRFVARIQEGSDGGLAKCSAEEMLRRVVTGAFGIADGLNERCERGGGTGDSAVCRSLFVYRVGRKESPFTGKQGEVSLRVAV